MKFIGKFTVVPSLPRELEQLRELAYNLYWTWNPNIMQLFRRLDSTLWEETHHNPVMLLGKIDQDRLREAAQDPGFLSHLKRAYDGLSTYMNAPTWFSRNYSDLKDFSIAYFSFEYGLTECLQTYSGGLGVLAGDHLKAASDLGIPLVGIGMNFKDGYFQQYLTTDGWQQERYEISDFQNQPMKIVTDENDEPLKVQVDFPDRTVTVLIWKIQVGRIPLYLMDSNIEENSPEDQKITQRLYGGDKETRIQQEILLGIGGIKMLHKLKIKPLVCHMNEGHSAFLSLERIAFAMNEYGLSFDEAKEIGYQSNIFTTHTPVPAGIDVFSKDLVNKYFKQFYTDTLKLTEEEFFRLGNIFSDTGNGEFNMAHLAMNTAGYVNGVSKLHAKVAKKMWQVGYKDIPFNDIPIIGITNGVHIQSHISADARDLLIRYLGESWVEDQSNESDWDNIEHIPDEELWRMHERRRERLVAFARRRLIAQKKARGASTQELQASSEVLDPRALTIGFARRFATYKRATLIFRDIARLGEILHQSDFPVQIIIAGKAHPKDDEGKRLIQEIIQTASTDEFRRKIVFLENYDMNVARYLVEGCDIWLNNPRRPLEASGTSGMKAISNGSVNFSVLDGWWDEAYEPEIGFKIGNGEELEDEDYQDEIEARELYTVLERDIVPVFYKRGKDGLPREWIKIMKNSMKKLAPVFNTHRMVKEYFTTLYLPSYDKRKVLMSEDWKAAKQLAQWKKKIKEKWDKIALLNTEVINTVKQLKVGDYFVLQAEVDLGELTPDDVQIEIYYGYADEEDDSSNFNTLQMDVEKRIDEKKNQYLFSGSIYCGQSGVTGFTLRILPKHNLLISPFDLKTICWAHQCGKNKDEAKK